MPEAYKDAKEWLSLLKGGTNEMVDEKLRKEMGLLMEQGRRREALELSRIIDVQVFTAMQQYLKIPILA